ncbi:MAG TPA: hypothetical protein VH253_17685 [Phycisphaerae bacterium]|nr:hypothetical protein [Phycisphaerae bacterium]
MHVAMAQPGSAAITPNAEPAGAAAAHARNVTGLPMGLLTSVLVFIAPRWAGRRWLGLNIPRAIIIACVHLLSGAIWLWAMLSATYAWFVPPDAASPPPLRDELTLKAGEVLHDLHLYWAAQILPDRISGVLAAVLLLAVALLVLFFMLLPMVARPGANRPCVRHVARAVLLGTGAIHFWGALYTAMCIWFYLHRFPQDETAVLSPILAAFCGLSLWHLAALVRAAGVDYRRPQDLPQRRDPLCDFCGYNLTMAPLAGRCPECGRHVSDSLGEGTRAGTPWERRKILGILPAIRDQLSMLIRSPRRLYYQTPALAGQRSARRWLIGSLLAVGFLAAWIVPGFYLVDSLVFSWRTIWGAAAMGMIWALMALMMVGIETCGVAAFSRMRGHPVALGTSAKVTAFAAPLMLAWVVLGGLQFLGADAFTPYVEHHFTSFRVQQGLLAGSLAVAHIGGLLWFELTVYGGVRAVQYANK